MTESTDLQEESIAIENVLFIGESQVQLFF